MDHSYVSLSRHRQGAEHRANLELLSHLNLYFRLSIILHSPFQRELLVIRGKQGTGKIWWPHPTQETVVGRRKGIMRIRGKAKFKFHIMGNIYFLCVILYRIIHIKKEQHIMKGPVNFLKGGNHCVNIFLQYSQNILLS